LEYSQADLAKIKARYPEKLSSLNFTNFGGLLGIGFHYPIQYNFSTFFESSYTHYFGNMIDDGDWKVSKLSIILGIKYKDLKRD